jgi:hypothetical protein
VNEVPTTDEELIVFVLIGSLLVTPNRPCRVDGVLGVFYNQTTIKNVLRRYVEKEQYDNYIIQSWIVGGPMFAATWLGSGGGGLLEEQTWEEQLSGGP